MALPNDIREKLRLPVMVAPMFLCSSVDLAIESCKAGLLGTLTRNHCRDNLEFEAQIRAVGDTLDRERAAQPAHPIGPLAVNISVGMDSEIRNEALEICRQLGIDIVVTAGGDPRPIVQAVHAWGGRLFHDVTNIRFAEKAIEAGVDGLIAIGAGGGGHSGTMSHLSLVPQIRAMFDGVIVMAGAISTGAAVRAAEILGADLAYMGTRFIATRESQAPLAYKEMLVAEQPANLIYTGAVNGVPAMWLKESMKRVGLDPDHLPVPSGHNRDHLPPDVKPWVNLWSAGQGIGLINDIPPVAELAERLLAEYIAACRIPPFNAAFEDQA